MKISEIIDIVERFAPLSLQEQWDNSGLQVGRIDRPLTGIVLSLDVTPDAIAKAKVEGANLIISHHPLLFNGIKSISEDSVEGRIVLDAIEAGITIYSSHTPLDSCVGGINDRLAMMIGLREVKVLCDSSSPTGIGRVGELAKPMAVSDFAGLLATTFNLKSIRSTAIVAPVISRVALCSGSGGELVGQAIQAGVDCYICGDLKYHNFGAANGVITVMDIGHAESEACAIDIFMEMLDCKPKKIPIFAALNSYIRYF